MQIGMYLLRRHLRALLLVTACGCTRPNPAYYLQADDGGDSLWTPVPSPNAPEKRPDGAPSVEVGPVRDAAPPEDVTSAVDGAPLEYGPPIEDSMPFADAAADRAPDSLPPGASAVDRMAVVATGGTTSTYGGPGGNRYPDACGSGSVLVGYRGYKLPSIDTPNNQYVISVQAVCARLRVPAGATAVEAVTPVMLALRGRATGQEWQVRCPANSAVVGFTARAFDNMVENFQFRCAPLAARAMPPGTFGVGPIVPLPWSGDRNPGMDVTTDCPPGQVGRGHVAGVGSWVDNYQMVCGTPSVSAP